MILNEPVDAVITWVDGQDPVHQNKRANALARLDLSMPEGAAPTRFNQCGELDYSVASIFRFAPWIRTIYIVTDAQTPSVMKKWIGTPFEKKIKLIDHREIFYGFEDCLPTFNSLTIECMLWRIQGLSEQFIYLNDDCSLIRPVTYDDFFQGKKVVLRGEWRVQSDKKLLRHFLKTPVEPELFRKVQETSAQMAGYHKQFFQFEHAPFPLKIKTFEEYFENNQEVMCENIRYTFRDRMQFWPLSLILHLEMKHKNAVFDQSLRAVSVHGTCHSLKKIQQRLSSADKNKQTAFVCMQSIDEAPMATQSIMLEWLKKRIEG